jgi:WD40 repeat protein
MWRPGGRTAVLDVERGAAAVVDPFTRSVLWRKEHDREATAVWSPDGQRLAVREASVWPHRGGAQITFWDVPPDDVLSPADPAVAAASVPVGPHHSDRDCVSWRPGAAQLVTTSDQGLLQFWDTSHHGPAGVTGSAGTALLHVRFSPDARRVAVAGERGHWVSVRPDGSGATPHGSYPFPGRDPATRQRWPEEVGVPPDRRPHGGPPVVVAFAPGEQHHLVGLWFEPLRVFTAAGQLAAELSCPDDARRWGGACFTPCGDRIVAAAGDSGWNDSAFSVWNVAGPGTLREAAAHSRYQTSRPADRHPTVWCVAASDTHAVMLAHPNYVGLFRLSDMQPVCWTKTNSPVYDASFDPSGRILSVFRVATGRVTGGLPQRTRLLCR